MDELPDINRPPSQPTLKLTGETLEIAKRIHELKKKSEQEYYEVMVHIHEYGNNLVQELNEKNGPPQSKLFEELGKELCLPEEIMKCYVVDATYLDDHDTVFLKYLEDPEFVYDPDNQGRGIEFEGDPPFLPPEGN